MNKYSLCSDEKIVKEVEALLVTAKDAEKIGKQLRQSLSRLIAFVSEKTGHTEGCLIFISLDLNVDVNGKPILPTCTCGIGWDNAVL